MDSQTPLLLEGPKAETMGPPSPPIIDLEAVDTTSASAKAESVETESSDTAAPDAGSRWHLPSFLPLAAAIVFAVVLGAIAGAATTSTLMREPAPSPATAEATRVLQDSVAQLGSELTALKAGVASVQRSASTQFGKLAERLDRSDKAQAEPAAKLAKLQETIDKIDHRQQAAADITNSVTPPKEEAKPQVAEGWRLRDFYAGRAVVENRDGRLFEVAPGSNLPGLGKVEGVKRENGKVVVTTRNGIIAASLEQRRPGYTMPYRY
jgi:hypothetical protein